MLGFLLFLYNLYMAVSLRLGYDENWFVVFDQLSGFEERELGLTRRQLQLADQVVLILLLIYKTAPNQEI